MDATADFVITSDGETRLLEKGPPHFAGAHPGCVEERRSTNDVTLTSCSRAAPDHTEERRRMKESQPAAGKLDPHPDQSGR